MGKNHCNNSFKKSSKKETRSKGKNIFCIGSSKQSSDYENTSQCLINNIKKECVRGNDISEALRNLTRPDTTRWEPTLVVSEDADQDVKAREDKQNELKCKMEHDAYLKRTNTFEENEFKAYADLWEHCAKALKAKIEARTDFQSNIFNNPINLLRSIKEHSLSYEEDRYEMATIADAFKDYFNCKQQQGESLLDYTRRFKIVRDILTSYLGGPIELKKYVKDDPDYVDGQQALLERLTVAADERLATYLHLANSDQGKHGSVLKNLNSQRSLKNDQFPKTIVDGNSVLSNHEFDKDFEKNKKFNKHKKKKHKDDDEGKEETATLSFAQLEFSCWCCGKKGHKSSTCNQRDKIPKDQWAINKSKSQFLQSETEKDKGTTEKESAKKKSIKWAGVHLISLAQKKEADKRKKEDSLGECIKWAA